MVGPAGWTHPSELDNLDRAPWLVSPQVIVGIAGIRWAPPPTGWRLLLSLTMTVLNYIQAWRKANVRSGWHFIINLLAYHQKSPT